MAQTKRRSCFQLLLFGFAGGMILCLALSGISALINRAMPDHSEVVDHLTNLDKARAAEIYHLRQSRGNEVLPGWDHADIPLILYNEAYAFLLNDLNPPDGWVTVPSGKIKGIAWEIVPGEDFLGHPYYRQRLLSRDENPQAFTVQVGDHWVASLTTYDWMKIRIAEEFRQDLPGPLKAVFPYSLALNMLVTGSDYYGTAVLHEAAHAYQGIRGGSRLAEAETARHTWEDEYPWEDDAFKAAWQAELDLLNEAVRAETNAKTIELASKFLAHRAERRTAARLSQDLVTYERQREWAEGIAKYAEISIYRQGASADYQPISDVLQDTQFHAYRGFQGRWNNEVNQIRLMAGAEGDGRFYYSGMAQAVMLDRLMPDWKKRLFDEDVWLEDLLAEAIR